MIKKVLICLSVIPVLYIMLLSVSQLAYGRSVMGTLSEIYLLITDRNAMFDTLEDFNENFEMHSLNQKNNDEYTIPASANVKIEFTQKKAHNMQIYYAFEENLTKHDTVIFYLHGGAFINDATKEHWRLINTLAEETNIPLIIPMYPKLPAYSCEYTYKCMMDLYFEIADLENIKHIIFMGDSSGGGLCLSLAKQLREYDLIKPEKLILIAPWIDLTMDTDGIEDMAKYDPVLGIYGPKELGKLWAGDLDVENPIVSPLFGSNEGLGEITMFVGTRDMLYLDILRYSEILNDENIKHTLVVEEGLNHPYVLYPTPEAKKAQKMIIDIINNEN